jgi:tRNA U55 pseudouridine synthase TruB
MTMMDLRRTKVGEYDINNSKKLEDISESDIIPIKDAINMKKINVTDELLLKKIKNGMKLENNYDDDYIMFIHDKKALAIYKKDNDIMRIDNLF